MKTDDNDRLFAKVGKFALALPCAFVVAMLSMLVYAWAISLVWGWYVVPLFGLAVLTKVQALGLAILVRLMRPSFIPQKSLKDEPWACLTHLFLNPALWAALAWFVMRYGNV